MPLYRWVDENTKYQLEVVKPFQQFDEPPTDEELPEEERGKDRKWVKHIGGTKWVRGSNFSGSKGNW